MPICSVIQTFIILGSFCRLVFNITSLSHAVLVKVAGLDPIWIYFLEVEIAGKSVKNVFLVVISYPKKQPLWKLTMRSVNNQKNLFRINKFSLVYTRINHCWQEPNPGPTSSLEKASLFVTCECNELYLSKVSPNHTSFRPNQKIFHKNFII